MVEGGEVIALCPILGGKSECKFLYLLKNCNYSLVSGEDKPFVKRVLPLGNVQWP